MRRELKNLIQWCGALVFLLAPNHAAEAFVGPAYKVTLPGVFRLHVPSSQSHEFEKTLKEEGVSAERFEILQQQKNYFLDEDHVMQKMLTSILRDYIRYQMSHVPLHITSVDKGFRALDIVRETLIVKLGEKRPTFLNYLRRARNVQEIVYAALRLGLPIELRKFVEVVEHVSRKVHFFIRSMREKIIYEHFQTELLSFLTERLGLIGTPTSKALLSKLFSRGWITFEGRKPKDLLSLSAHMIKRLPIPEPTTLILGCGKQESVHLMQRAKMPIDHGYCGTCESLPHNEQELTVSLRAGDLPDVIGDFQDPQFWKLLPKEYFSRIEFHADTQFRMSSLSSKIMRKLVKRLNRNGVFSCKSFSESEELKEHFSSLGLTPVVEEIMSRDPFEKAIKRQCFIKDIGL